MTSKISTDDLRSFYFSKATKYENFVSKSNCSLNINKTTPVEVSTIGNISFSDVDISPVHVSPLPYRGIPTPVPTPTSNTKYQSRHQTDNASAVGSALAIVRRTNQGNTLSTSLGDTVSTNYITFLRQQQDLMKAHHTINDLIREVVEYTDRHRKSHKQKLTELLELLHSAEMSTDWSWTSKFNIGTLYKDAALEVPTSELFITDTNSESDKLKDQQQVLVSLRQQYCCGENYKSNKYPFGTELKSTLENGISCFDRLIKEYSSSQLDVTPVARMSDDLLDQLGHVLSQNHISNILQEINDTIEALTNKEKDCRLVRDQALKDGIMEVAERETYALAGICEEIANAQVRKIEILSIISSEVVVNLTEVDKALKKSQQVANVLERDSEHLRSRCDSDIVRMNTLKEQVDRAEKTISERIEKERSESDTRLGIISSQQLDAWDQIVSLLNRISDLEMERHQEVKKRMEMKNKDEKRRNEYATFNMIAKEQLVNYDRTILNSNINIHCAILMGEYLCNGFKTISKGLEKRKESIDEVLLEAQKSHLEGYRSLMFTLGDLEYRKERKAEELAESVQAAYIQQEMCADSLNPSAKKYSDTKKDLLLQRDEVLLDLRDIKVRQETSTVQFQPTKQALLAANIPYRNPVDELDDMKLEQREKIVEYKAMALRRNTSFPVHKELQSLKRQLVEAKKVIISKGGTLNTSQYTSSSVNRIND